MVAAASESVVVSTVIVTCIAVTAVFSVRQALISRLGPLDVKAFFPVGLCLYSFSYPLSLARQGRWSELSYYTAFVAAIGLLACLAGCACVRSARAEIPKRSGSRQKYQLLLYAGVLMSLLGIASYFVVFSEAGGGFAYFQMPYSERYLVERGLGFVTLWRGLTLPGVALIFCSSANSRSPRSRVLLSILVIACVFFLELLSARRRLFLSLLLSSVAAYYIFVYRFNWRRLTFVLPVLWVGIASFGYIRGLLGGRFLGSVELDMVVRSFSWSWLDPGRMEFGYAFRILDDVIEHVPQDYPFWLGRSYIEILFQQIPLKVLGNVRPLSPTEWYVSTLYPDVYARGGGYAFFTVAEGYLNFGLIGVVLHMFVLGLLLGFARRYLLRSELGAVIYCLFLPSLVSLIRGSLSGFVKECLIGKVLPVGVMWVIVSLFVNVPWYHGISLGTGDEVPYGGDGTRRGTREGSPLAVSQQN
ncbi:MAG: oligosaccharide repeat unit polymerase [Firmicutes bacterium]|nr:oligosaccharide repeat unit polymerase [Bacillota bacterium]MDH7496244.1 O-antigen polymerase [Bacillota bacterium]